MYSDKEEKNMINDSLLHKAFKLFTHKNSLFLNKCKMMSLVKPNFYLREICLVKLNQ